LFFFFFFFFQIITAVLEAAGLGTVDHDRAPMMNFIGGLPHMTKKQSLVQGDGQKFRSNMESHPTFQGYLQLKFSPRGGQVFEPFAGTSSGVRPALLLGRHWQGSEVMNNVYNAGKKRYQEQVRDIIADGVDLDEVYATQYHGWGGDQKFLNEGLMSQWTANINQGTPWTEAVWKLASEKDLEDEEVLAQESSTFGLEVRTVTEEDITQYNEGNEKAALDRWSEEVSKFWEQKAPGIDGDANKPLMRGVFNTAKRGVIEKDEIICLISGVWIRAAQAWSMAKGYLPPDKELWPAWGGYLFEIADCSPALFVNAADGPVQVSLFLPPLPTSLSSVGCYIFPSI
jgi:hypothetical protein